MVQEEARSKEAKREKEKMAASKKSSIRSLSRILYNMKKEKQDKTLP
jgi:hypothetical protein